MAVFGVAPDREDGSINTLLFGRGGLAVSIPLVYLLDFS